MGIPDCLSAIPAAIRFLQKQPGITQVGVVGISLGGALTIRSLVESSQRVDHWGGQPQAAVVMETPVQLNYNRALFLRESWRAFRAPVLSLLRNISVRQMIQSWQSGGYSSQYATAELIDLLNPVESIGRLKDIPILLVFADRDPIAPPVAARALRQAAPQADLLLSKKASHVTLTLMPEINRQVARWLKTQLNRAEGHFGID
jgi:pimeloyl-ACP methyl ester carboxylesterase